MRLFVALVVALGIFTRTVNTARQIQLGMKPIF